ncbi:Homoserine O-acetyltransferase [Psilocybe cubensis]|uniref:Homoserine O-acetyltransferase n=2 Tax=Psilocybe cubensis TaxID=181762 RepID=A0ACB8GW13_PSICU|nr:Homoserine O-acetyltransferase [Psilocybe cubensis]KAH9479761.1 Homoserine O-acetyltransferase [Psilocybe cubensis]
MSETQYHHHGRFPVAGGVLPDAITAYRTYGDPKNPCIVFPTCYGGRLDSQDYMVGEDKVLSTKKYYVVTLALFSNGESSSPSNTPAPYNGPYFPAVSYEDNIRAQYAVLQKLGVQKAFAVVGFSMGGQQAYYWAVMYPDFVERYVAICGSARTSPHNQCFLEGPKAALLASKDFDGGHYKTQPEIGKRAFGRVYSAWAYGQTWFRQHGHLHGGKYPNLESFLREDWEGGFLGWDANDLLTLLHTWQTGDVSLVRDGGDLGKCLSSIKAKGLIMPSKTDLYFPPEDSVDEVANLQNTARLVVIDTVWGHMAGGGANEADDKFIADEITKFFEE